MKRFLAMFVLTSLLLAVPVLASGETLSESVKSRDVDVTYTINESYLVTIPDSIPASLSAEGGAFTVSYSGNVPVTVSISSYNRSCYSLLSLLKGGNPGTSIPYKLYSNGSEYEFQTFQLSQSVTSKTFNAVLSVLESQLVNYEPGDYKDTLTFTLS